MQRQNEADVLWYGAVCVQLSTQRVFVQGQAVHLAPMEYCLLCYLLQHQGQILSRRELFLQVWGAPAGLKTRTLDAHVHALRKKLALGGRLETVFRVGYRLRLPAEAGAAAPAAAPAGSAKP